MTSDGGLAGSGGAGPPDGGVLDGSIDDCGCLATRVSWGPNGGRVAYTDTSALSPCKTFSHQRTPGLTDPPTLMCSQELGTCATSITAAQVATALAHADVQAAIASAPVLYGRDTRPVDGAVLRIQIGAAVVEVGLPCAGSSGCMDIPPGIDALAALLRQLSMQELDRPPCRDTFRPG